MKPHRLVHPRFALLMGTALLAGSCITYAPDPWVTPHLPTKVGRAHQESSHHPMGSDWEWIEPHSTIVLADVDGPGMIRRVWMAIGTATDPIFTRKCVVRMYWDDETEPSVEVPVGDFYGSGFTLQGGVDTKFFHQSSGGMICFWPMPFDKNARIEITNDSDSRYSIYYQVTWTEEPHLPRDAMRFHAQWRQSRPLEFGRNHTVLEATGHGRLAGVNLDTSGAYQHRTSYLEGDDLMWIDGDQEPSIAGTGTEEAFNSAWYFGGGPNARQTNNIVMLDPVNSRYSVNRLYLHEDITFHDSFRFELEHADNYNSEKADYATTVFWYQDEPHAPFPPLPPVDERLPRLAAPVYTMPDVVEGESVLHGYLFRTTTYFEEVSQFMAMMPTPESADPDGGYTIPIDAATTTTYQLGVNYLKHASGGEWALEFNGERVGEPVDTYDPERLSESPTSINRAMGMYVAGMVEADAGTNTLRLVPAGINPAAIDRVYDTPPGSRIVIPRGAVLVDAFLWKPVNDLHVEEVGAMLNGEPSGPRPLKRGRHDTLAAWSWLRPADETRLPFVADNDGPHRLTVWFAGASRPADIQITVEDAGSTTMIHLPEGKTATAHALPVVDLTAGGGALVLSLSGDDTEPVEIGIDRIVVERFTPEETEF